MIPTDPTVADELSCLCIGRVVLEILCHSPNAVAWPILRNVFSSEADLGRNIFCGEFLAQHMLPSSECFQYHLQLFGDRKDNDDSSHEECVDGILEVNIIVDGRISGVSLQGRFRERSEISRSFSGWHLWWFNHRGPSRGCAHGAMRLASGNESMSYLAFLREDTSTQDSDRTMVSGFTGDR